MPRRGSKRSGAEEGGGEEETETTTTTQQPSPRKQSPARSKKAKGGGEGEEKGSTATAAASEGESSSSSSSSSMDIEQSKERTSTPASSMGAERVIPTEKCGVCGAVEPRGFIVPDYIKRYEENAKSEGLDYKVIEEGRLIFMYRPKVTLHHVEKKEDIQRFYLVMEAMRTPLGEESRRVANAVYHHNMHVKSKDHEHGVHESSQQHKQIISTLTGDKGRAKELDSIEPTLYRVLTIPAKHLPKKIDKPGKYATVLSVSTDRNMIHEEMKERTYGAATRGSRFQDKARIVAEAFYMIVRETHNNKRLSKLVYAIESPKEVTEPMKIFNIQMHGAFIMNVFNPERRSEGLGREARPTELAEYPPYLQQLFEGLKTSILKSVPVDPPSFLNYQHTSLLFIDASDRLHKDLHPLLELVEKEEQLDIEAYGEKDLTEKPLKELNTTMDELPVVGKKLE